MNSLFPFGFPAPTALYLTLYVLTLVLHVAFMNYVLGGATWLVIAYGLDLRPGREERPRPVVDLLRDWLPFMLSAAITAGIAPLLFVQVLYQKQFYTANLLLFHRWMAILPALLVGFYLLYLLKSKLLARPWLRFVVAAATLSCFGFTGWSWTENHLLSINAQAWVEQYASGRLLYRNAELPPRLLLWLTGAAPTLALIVAWQLWYAQRHRKLTEFSPRTFCILPLVGMTLSFVAGIGYFFALGPEVRTRLAGNLAGAYVGLALLGWLIAAGGWIFQARQERLSALALAIASGGWLLAVLGLTVVREARRLLALDVESLYSAHAAAAKVGGLGVFLVFLLLNAAAIAACFWIVRSGLPNSAPDEEIA